MHLVSFRTPGNTFLSVNSASRLVAIATVTMPDQSTEFIVENLTRPGSDRYAVGDHLEIRSMVNNHIWRMATPPQSSGRSVVPIAVDRTTGAWSRSLSEVVVVATSTVDADGHFRVRLNSRYPSMLLAAGGGGGGIDPEVIFRDGFELQSLGGLIIGADGVVAADSGAVGTSPELSVVPHRLRAMLRAANGLCLTMNNDGRLVTVAGDLGRLQEFTLVTQLDANKPRLMHGDVFRLRAPNGQNCHFPASGAAAGAGTTAGLMLQMLRLAGEGEVQDGDRVAIIGYEFAPEPDREPYRLTFEPVTDGRSGRVVLRRGVLAPGSTFTVEFSRTLRLFWNGTLGDNAMDMGEAAGGGYGLVRAQIRALLAPRAGTVPLRSFWHAGRGDTMTTATLQGETAAAAVAPPYEFQRMLGFVFGDSQPGTVPLKQYWNGARGDHFLAATELDERSASDAGYNFAWIEGHAPLAPSPMLTVVPGVLDPRIGGIAGSLVPGGFPGTGPVLPPATPRPVKALVLSGGGAKGCFEAGAVQTLWANGYRPDFICGVSVGAINASYLALGHDAAADELVAQWREFSSAPGRIFREDHYLNVISQLAGRVGGRAADALIATAGGATFGAALGGLIGFFAGKEASGLDGATVRLINFMLTMTHAMHSMEPLRQLLRRTFTPDYFRRLRESRVGLHVGITDMKTGQYLTVSGPRPDWTDPQIADCGSVFVEPDHQLGETWLSRPVFGFPYAMPLVDAVYASSALPAYMEPLQVNLAASRRINTPAGSFTRLSAGLPTGLAGLLAATRAGSDRGANYLEGLDWAAVEHAIDGLLGAFPTAALRNNVPMARSARDGQRGLQSQTHLFFDGGLRDTLPIRTALRLGATEITVITGDQLQRAQRTYPLPKKLDPALACGVLDLLGGAFFEGTDLGATPLAQHVLGLLGMWFNEASRSDLLLALGQVDQLSTMRRATERMDAGNGRVFRDTWRADENRRISERYRNLGAATPIGGNAARAHAFGEPFASAGATIRLIGPDREIIGPLAFEDREAIEDGIEFGRDRALTPVIL
jgi:predicted acylesterase/phospholipase RssA